MPSFFADDFVRAYPDIKYILTERDPDSWVRSWKSTIAVAAQGGWGLLRQIARYFDPMLYWVHRSMDPMIDWWTGGKMLTKEGYAHSRDVYINQ
jgi:hypothetical protein